MVTELKFFNSNPVNLKIRSQKKNANQKREMPASRDLDDGHSHGQSRCGASESTGKAPGLVPADGARCRRALFCGAVSGIWVTVAKFG